MYRMQTVLVDLTPCHWTNWRLLCMSLSPRPWRDRIFELYTLDSRGPRPVRGTLPTLWKAHANMSDDRNPQDVKYITSVRETRFDAWELKDVIMNTCNENARCYFALQAKPCWGSNLDHSRMKYIYIYIYTYIYIYIYNSCAQPYEIPNIYIYIYI